MTPRAFCILLSLFAVSTAANAQGYFCDRQGARLEYVRKVPKTGETRWRHILKVSDVIEDGSATAVTTVSTFLKANGKPYYKTDVTERVWVDADFNATADMEMAMTSYIKARAGLSSITESTPSVLPSDMQPGDTLPQISGKAKVGPLTYTFRIWDRKVLRRETISLPAGTFDCVVLEEHKLESGPGHNRDVINHTWYSKGVGFVRHDTYIKGVLDTSEILQSIQ